MDDYLKQTIAVYDKIADDYARRIITYAPTIERDTFISLVKKGGSILDVGCAAGRDCEYFNEKGFQVTGVDLSNNLLRIARKKSNSVRYVYQDARDLQFPDQSFDGIYACAVLIHLKKSEILSVLRSFWRILKKNGILFIAMKEGKDDVEVKEALSSHEVRHFTLVGTDEFTRWMSEAGFSIIKLNTWNSKDRWPERTDVVWINCFARKAG